jgi:hypothetical protein
VIETVIKAIEIITTAYSSAVETATKTASIKATTTEASASASKPSTATTESTPAETSFNEHHRQYQRCDHQNRYFVFEFHINSPKVCSTINEYDY